MWLSPTSDDQNREEQVLILNCSEYCNLITQLSMMRGNKTFNTTTFGRML